MKRFTATEKWDDPWFWELSPPAKLMWIFLCDHCDHAGILDVSLKLASTKIGQPIKEHHLAELQSRLYPLESGKHIITSFIRFQYGKLSRDCKPHRPAFMSLEKHGIDLSHIETISKGYSNPTKGYQVGTNTNKEPSKEKEPEKERDGFLQVGIDSIPEVLNEPRFIEAWVRWHDHLKQKRKPATIHARDLQLAKLAKMGVPKAIETLNNCIEHNWQGIYAIDDASRKPDRSKLPFNGMTDEEILREATG